MTPARFLCSLVVLLAPLASGAVEKCKLKQDRDSTLRVSARGVDGDLLYGYSEDHVRYAIDGAACVDESGTAKKCPIAEEGADARTTAPPHCALFLEDDTSSCRADLKRCTPDLRPVCPPDMQRLGGGCIDRSANAGLEFGPAGQACHALGRSLCSVEELTLCDTVNVFARPVRYGGNILDEQATDTGGIYDYFCCAPLGTP